MILLVETCNLKFSPLCLSMKASIRRNKGALPHKTQFKRHILPKIAQQNNQKYQMEVYKLFQSSFTLIYRGFWYISVSVKGVGVMCLSSRHKIQLHVSTEYVYNIPAVYI